MPDITMCTGTKCPKKDNCYRFRATANPYRQSYFCVPPFESREDKECEYFWDIKDRIDIYSGQDSKWNLSRFIGELEEMGDDFYHNLTNLGDTTRQTKEKWMEMFLRWAEWKTEVHDEHWK